MLFYITIRQVANGSNGAVLETCGGSHSITGDVVYMRIVKADASLLNLDISWQKGKHLFRMILVWY